MDYAVCILEVVSVSAFPAVIGAENLAVVLSESIAECKSVKRIGIEFLFCQSEDFPPELGTATSLAVEADGIYIVSEHTGAAAKTSSGILDYSEIIKRVNHRFLPSLVYVSARRSGQTPSKNPVDVE